MELEATKRNYIKLRAEGRSYAYIAKELGISKSTCYSWEHTFKEEVAELKQESMEELYTSYFMTKAARIKRLGDTLANIEEALSKADLSTVAPEKLLDYKLKFMEALKAEYTPTPTSTLDLAKVPTDKAIVSAMLDLLERVRAGEVTTLQASKESMVLSNLLKAFDAVELKTKLEALEAILERSAV